MNINKFVAPVAIALTASLMLTGCGRKIGSDQVSAGSVGTASRSYQGTIVSVRHVTVSENDKLGENTTGIGAGALAGGLVGSAFGRGNGTLVGIGAGALLGGIGGAFAEDALGEQGGYEYTVKTTDGTLLNIVQGDKTPMAVGQRVFVSVSTNSNARSRVYPDNSGLPMEVQQTKPLPGESHGSPLVVVNTK